jgi:D-lactate dehydrogenase (cytochrome)
VVFVYLFSDGFILGHVGDGNFHTLFLLDPNNPKELEFVQETSEKIAL